MPHYLVHMSVTIDLTVEVEALDKEHAKDNWASYKHALQEAKLAVAEEARMLEDFEFDVESVEEDEYTQEDEED